MRRKFLTMLLCITMIFTMYSVAFADEELGGGDGNPPESTEDITNPPAPVDISTLGITLSYTTYTYNGKEKKPVVKIAGLVKGTDFTVTYPTDCKTAGTKKIKIKGIGNYTGTVYKTYTIKKAEQNLKITTSKRTVKYSEVKSKSVYTKKLAVSGAKGTLTFKKVSGSSKLTITSGGKIKVKKGTKCGTYKIKVRAYSKYTSNYKSAKKTKTITVKVINHSTSSAYRKYVCRWESVDVDMQVRVMNDSYISAYLINNITGEKIYFKRDTNMTKRPVKISLKNKYGDDVILRLKLDYGNPYTDYSGNRVIEGIKFNIESNDYNWRQGFVDSNGTIGYCIFCKYL